MALPKLAWLLIAIPAALVLFGAWMFMKTRDPMILLFAIMAALMAGGIAFVVWILRRGIPVRVVNEPPK